MTIAAYTIQDRRVVDTRDLASDMRKHIIWIRDSNEISHDTKAGAIGALQTYIDWLESI
jgi:hypothetical protein